MLWYTVYFDFVVYMSFGVSLQSCFWYLLIIKYLINSLRFILLSNHFKSTFQLLFLIQYLLCLNVTIGCVM